MSRLTLAALAGLVVALPACAQEAPPADRIYIAQYQISYGDIPAWIEAHATLWAPAMDALVESGVINNHNVRMHNTGGNFNFRIGIIGSESTNYEDFWDQYLSSVAAADAASFEATNRMIQAHNDEIWNITSLNLGDGAGQARYLYESYHKVNFSDLEAFNETYNSEIVPVLEGARADGFLAGWVVQEHNTGGDYNWKMGLLIDEWDDIDELQAAMFGSIPLTHPFWSMFTAHKDELWENLPES